jgi:hypothetical protein
MWRTGPYYAGMPWDVAVCCPRCDREASFTPPHYALFDRDARAARDNVSIMGMGDDRYYRVIRYPKLLPWSHPSNREYNWHKGEGWGICICPACGYHNKHLLNWPSDAYYAVQIRDHMLWAWNRQYATALRQYLEAPEQPPAYSPEINNFLVQVPKTFRLKRNRELARKKLARLLLPS